MSSDDDDDAIFLGRSIIVLKHKTVGLFSEEGESVHKVVNQQSRQLCSVRKIGERNLLIHKNLELARGTSRKPLETLRRTCRECGVFFRWEMCVFYLS